eukprot:CAMPEP_0172323198 /NCGR_PEP_ID=MMETSP1058-20130122/48132_1 /TAXON_ID=83371 /ORGANISM="Detonula confervacea, Strain CCMP 353" /LENGTH=64 /DNA_ID=CAMNT_0013039145 /DNA_START=20 /DNA_END=211 /DNA_ORIENTATION=+
MTTYQFLSIAILLLFITAAVLINFLSTFEGGPHDGARLVPKEAVSIFETDELPLFVRLFGYLWG